MDGQPPNNLAPLIFRLTKIKSACVKNALTENHLLAMLHPITSVVEINELVQLGDRLRNVEKKTTSLRIGQKMVNIRQKVHIWHNSMALP